MVDPVERTTGSSVLMGAVLIWFAFFMTGCGEHAEHGGQPSPTTGQRQLRTSGTSIVDEQGRTVILRGVNYNGIESMLFTEQPPALDDFKKIKRWGFNVIRFPVSWDFIEPERDHYDEEYLRNWVEPVLDFAARRQYQDLHDDVLKPTLRHRPHRHCHPRLPVSQPHPRAVIGPCWPVDLCL